MKTIKYIISFAIGIIILSFYLPYCSGDGDAKLAETYAIKGISNSWKWIVIWLIIILGGLFIYSTFTEEDEK